MSPTTSQMRAAILARLAQQAPAKKLGRTAVMKTLYFLQELADVPLGYDFRLYTYGPFDADVLGDLAMATARGLVCERMVLFPRGYGYEVTPLPAGEQAAQSLEPALAQAVDRAIAEFGALGAAELELRSTIVFVDREFAKAGRAVAPDALANQVRQIKPHFTTTTILTRVREMCDKGWLKSVEQVDATSWLR